jgi:hypothetical protein
VKGFAFPLEKAPSDAITRNERPALDLNLFSFNCDARARLVKDRRLNDGNSNKFGVA